MQRSVVSRIVVVVFIASLTLSFLYEFGIAAQKETEVACLRHEVNNLKTSLSSNASQVVSLESEIEDLKREIQDLQSVITIKKIENEKLNRNVNDLQCAIDEIQNGLESLVEIEQIQLLVERLRNEPELLG